MLCSEAIKVNSNGTGGQAFILTCKRWSCPICQPVNRKRVMRQAAKGEPTTFLTLTATRKYESPHACAQAMRDAFARLIRILRKRFPGQSIEYFRVFEAHPSSGWPHLHVLLRCPFVHWRVLRAIWQKLIGAFMVDVRGVKNAAHAAFYLAKYLGKDLHKFDGVTRYYRSRGYLAPREDLGPKVRFGPHWQTHEGSPHLTWWKVMLDARTRGALFEEQRFGFARWAYPMRKGP